MEKKAVKGSSKKAKSGAKKGPQKKKLVSKSSKKAKIA